MPHPTPRLFLLRHGETEWSLSGQHTGTTDIPLTDAGVKRSIATGKALVGDDRLIVRKNLCGIYVSPRSRAQKTLALLMGGEKGNDPSNVVEFEVAEGGDEGGDVSGVGGSGGKVRAHVTSDVAEWDYGEYEGITSKEIKKRREEKGEGDWDIWRDGCPGGESPHDIDDRLDRFITLVREKHHKPAFEHIEKDKKPPPCDVLVVAHGHILRALAARWVGRDVTQNPNLILEAGGVACLRYVHFCASGLSIYTRLLQVAFGG